MKNFLLSLIVLGLFSLVFVLVDLSHESPEEYSERLAMEDQQNFMKHWSDKAGAEIDRRSNEMLEAQRK